MCVVASVLNAVDSEAADEVSVYTGVRSFMFAAVGTILLLQNMTFELANRYSNSHLIVQPSDARLAPPESYLFIQDGLIISCGVLYALCYLFYMARTYKDKTLSGSVEYLYATSPPTP